MLQLPGILCNGGGNTTVPNALEAHAHSRSIVITGDILNTLSGGLAGNGGVDRSNLEVGGPLRLELAGVILSGSTNEGYIEAEVYIAGSELNAAVNSLRNFLIGNYELLSGSVVVIPSSIPGRGSARIQDPECWCRR